MGRLREESLSHTLRTVWMPFKGHFSGFPLASHLELPGSQSIFGVSQDLPLCVCTHLLAKMDSTEEAYGYNIPWHPSPLTSKEPFCACVVREVAWLGEWEICGMTRAQIPPLIILLFLSWSFSPQGMNLQLLYSGWGPVYFLLQL